MAVAKVLFKKIIGKLTFLQKFCNLSTEIGKLTLPFLEEKVAEHIVLQEFSNGYPYGAPPFCSAKNEHQHIYIYITIYILLYIIIDIIVALHRHMIVYLCDYAYGCLCTRSIRLFLIYISVTCSNLYVQKHESNLPKKQLRGLIKSYQDVSNQPLLKNMVRLRSENQWLSPVPGSHGGCQMLEGQELPFLRRLHLQQVADQTVFEDSAEAEELHVEQVAWGNRCHTVDAILWMVASCTSS